MTLEQALERRGRCDYSGALDALAEVDEPAALIERSRLHEDLGDYDAARADAERAASLAEGTPLAPPALARLAGATRAQGRPDEATRILEGVPGAERGVRWSA